MQAAKNQKSLLKHMQSNQQSMKNDLFALPLQEPLSPEPKPVQQQYDASKLSIFQTSNVLDKNQPIQSPQRSQGQRPFDTFFDKMGELGYEAANVSQTFCIDNSNCMSKSRERRANERQTPEQRNQGEHQFSDAFIESKMQINSQFRKQFQKKIDQLDANISGLSFEKHKIINCIHEYQQAMEATLNAFSRQWEEQLQNYMLQLGQKTQYLEKQLEFYVSKCSMLERQKETNELHSSVLSNNLNDLEQVNTQLNRQLQNIESQNHELKYAVNQGKNAQEELEALQEEINSMNRVIDQNSEYIFDLQQKVAGAALELEEKETQMKKQLQQRIEEEREKIQDSYKQEFGKLHDEIQKRVEEQVESQYQNSLANIQRHHQKQLSAMKSQLEKQIKQLQDQNLKLSKSNREQESRLHEIEQHQMKKHTVSTEQDSFNRDIYNSRVNQSLERKLREKDEQLEYYRMLANKSEGREYAKKTHNIFVVDSDKSRFIQTEAAVSPSSSLANLYQTGAKDIGRNDKINTILSRIRLRQSSSVLGLDDMSMSMSRESRVGLNQSIMRPVSPESVILERQKDMRMRNISHKLEQLRADIRRQIGMIPN